MIRLHHAARCAGAGVSIVATLLLGYTGTHAAAAAHSPIGASIAGAGSVHLTSPGRFGHHAISGFNHMYVDTGDGASCTGTADAIDVFDNSGNQLQAFTTDANNCYAIFGSNALAYVKAKKQACLVLADDNFNSAPGYWDSFTLNSNGTIKAEVSHTRDFYKNFPNYGTPEDVVALPGGKQVLGLDNTQNAELLTVGKGCKLSKGIKTATANTFGELTNGAAISASTADAVDYTNNVIDEFSIKPFALVATAPAAVANSADGLSSLGNTVAVGSAQSGVSQVASGQQSGTAITWGGTAADTNLPDNGTSDTGLASGCLFGGDEYNSPGGPASVSWFTLAGSPPAPAYSGSQTLPNASPDVGPFLNVGSTELVNAFFGGVIYGSSIGSGCALTLTPFATLSDPNGTSNSIAID